MKFYAGMIVVAILMLGPVGVGLGNESSEWEKLNAETEQTYLKGQYPAAMEKARQAHALAEKTYGASSREAAMSLNMIAVIYQTVGQYEKAELEFRRSMAIREKTLGVGHADFAESLNNMAVLYRSQGRYAESEQLDLRALAIREKVLAADHDDVVISLNNLGSVTAYLGRYEQGERYFLRAIGIYEKKYGKQDAKLAHPLNNLAELYRQSGKYDTAEALYLRAIAILEAVHGPDHPNVALYKNNLALLYHDKGHYPKAKELYLTSLALFEKTLGSKHPIVATTKTNIGNVFFRQGDYVQAEKTYTDAMAMREAIYGTSHPDFAASLTNLAMVYYDQSKYEQAVAMHQRALPIFEKAYGPGHPDVAKSLSNLALAYSGQGQYEQALPLFRRAVSIREKALGPEHADVANGLNNLGHLYVRLGDHTQAEPVLKRAIAIWEKALGPDFADVAAAAGNLAAVYVEQERYSEAEQMYQRAVAITERAQGPMHARVASNLNSLAGLYVRQRQFDKAEPLYNRSLSIWQTALGQEHYQTSLALSDLSDLHLRQGRQADALAMARASTKILRRRYVSLQSGSAIAKLAEQKTNSGMFFQHLDALGASMGNGASSTTLASEGFEVAQLARASNVGHSVAQMSVRFAQRGDALALLVRGQQDAQEAHTRANANLLTELSLSADKRNAQKEAGIRDQIAAFDKTLAAQNAVIAERFPNYQALISQEPIAAREAQKLLGAEEALLVYTVTDDKTFAWVVTRKSITSHTLAVTSQDLEKQVKFVRSKLVPSAAGDLAEMTPTTSSRLSSSIFGPLEASLIGVEHIIVVPDGALQSLPFAVLTSQGTTLEWLAKRYSFSVVPSVSSLRALRLFGQGQLGTRPFAGFGDPVLSGGQGGARNLAPGRVFKTRGLEFNGSTSRTALADVDVLRQAPSLPETAEELTAIAKILKGSPEALFLRQDATETKVKQSDLSDYRFLAFATHGVMAGELSGVAEPGLVLTPPATATENDDGYLSAGEVAQLKLNADWVLLSACNTSAPDGTPGAEGLSGLARAFFYAGSRSLLVSNWPVASDATKSLITDVISTYSSTPGLRKAQAVKQAMNRMMESTNYAHPFYWGAFMVVGD